MRLSNRRCYYRNDKNAAASSKVQSIQPEECVGLTAGSGAVETAPATALTNSTRARMPRPRTCRGLTCHFHIRVIKVNRARRARSPTRRGGLAAAARATCAHLSPPPHHQEPDGTPKQWATKDVPQMFAPPSAWTQGPKGVRSQNYLPATPNSRAETFNPNDE